MVGSIPLVKSEANALGPARGSSLHPLGVYSRQDSQTSDDTTLDFAPGEQTHVVHPVEIGLCRGDVRVVEGGGAPDAEVILLCLPVRPKGEDIPPAIEELRKAAVECERSTASRRYLSVDRDGPRRTAARDPSLRTRVA